MVDTTGYTLFETAFGLCGIAWSERGVVRLVLPEATAADTETRLRRQARTDARVKPPPAVGIVISLVQAYFDGADIDFLRVALDLGAEAEVERRGCDRR